MSSSFVQGARAGRSPERVSTVRVARTRKTSYTQKESNRLKSSSPAEHQRTRARRRPNRAFALGGASPEKLRRRRHAPDGNLPAGRGNRHRVRVLGSLAAASRVAPAASSVGAVPPHRVEAVVGVAAGHGIFPDVARRMPALTDKTTRVTPGFADRTARESAAASLSDTGARGRSSPAVSSPEQCIVRSSFTATFSKNRI